MAVFSGAYVEEPRREVKVFGTYDVVVAGGGSAGVAAAMAAARSGSRVLVIERCFSLGGMMTSGLVTKCALPPIISGIPRAIFTELQARGHGFTPEDIEIPYNAEAMKKLLDELMEEHNVDVLLGTLVTDVLVEEGRVKGVFIENKSGSQYVETKIVIDATGDADVSTLAGAEIKKGRAGDGLMSAPSLLFKMSNVDFRKVFEYMREKDYVTQTVYWRFTVDELEERHFGEPRRFVAVGQWMNEVEQAVADAGHDPAIAGPLTNRNGVHFYNLPNEGEVMINVTKILRCDGSIGQHVSDAMIEGRRQVKVIADFVKKYVPGFENASMVNTADILGVRESRRIVGHYTLTGEDILTGRKFPDSICRHSGGYEIHTPDGRGIDVTRLEAGLFYDMPYRAFVPVGVGGLMVAGRCYSGDHEALSAARCISLCLAIGEAMGTAASICAKENIEPIELDVSRLQEVLIAAGADVGSRGK